jgi:hypothetical protein
LHDLRAGSFDDYLDPDNWGPAQRLAASLKAAGSDGIVYPSVRYSAGQATALFWPDLIRLPVVQARTLQYHWDGSSMTRYFIIGETDWYTWPQL